MHHRVTPRTVFLTILLFFSSLAYAEKNLVLATATTGGTYYPVGVSIATLVSIKLGPSHQIMMHAISSAGSGENIDLLKSNEAQMALLQGLLGSMAWQGLGHYKRQKQTHLRAITMLWENVEHFTVHADYAPTGNITDLKSFNLAKFSMGGQNSGTRISGETILHELGIDPQETFTIEYMGYMPSSHALRMREIQGMNTPAGPPVKAVKKVFHYLGRHLRILNFTDIQLELVNRTYPVWSRYTIPPFTYPGQNTPIDTIAQPNFLAVRPDVDNQTVYQITKVVYENLSFLHSIHDATRAINLDRAIQGLPVPLHPGAAQYYQEQDIEIPAAIQPPPS